MTEQEEIKQEMGQWVLRIRQYLLNTEFCPEPFTKPVDVDVLKNKFPDEILTYLDSQGVVIKVERGDVIVLVNIEDRNCKKTFLPISVSNLEEAGCIATMPLITK